MEASDGKLVRIRTQDIDRQQTTDVSLMPEGLEASLSFEEFADLIAYLASLKAPQNTAVAYHGMPPVIPELKTPVRLVPFIAPEHQFQHPVWFGPVPGLPDAFAVVEHESGKIWLIRKNGSDETKTLFLDTGKFIRGTCMKFTRPGPSSELRDQPQILLRQASCRGRAFRDAPV